MILCKAEAAAGGKYRESMQCGDDIHIVFGTYREIVADRSLVFTYLGEEPGAVVTDVAVYFTDKNGGSEVTLSQSGFANAVSARGHEEGWASAPGNPARQFPEQAIAGRRKHYAISFDVLFR